MEEEKTEQPDISFATKVWADVYESLIKDGVVFPDKFNGVGAAYRAFAIIDKAIQVERDITAYSIIKSP